MKNKLPFIYLFLIFLFIGCNNDDETSSDCGCDSKTRISIPISSSLSGKMFYKIGTPEDNYYINKFWIEYTQPDCGNCQHYLIICNENILVNNYDDLKDLISGETIDITFSGNIKPICEWPNAWLADQTFERILLTSIKIK